MTAPPDTDIAPGETPPPGRPLPLATQAIALAGFALVLILALVVVPAALSHAAPDDAGGGPDAAFQPTPQQWAGLQVRRVETHAMAPRIAADGRIALNDNTSTPIYSPLSGRITRILADLGTRVAAGSALFGVRSPEIAQAQSDLVGALATLRTARVQLELATAAEARQHALYLAHGAALKDWQQSRVDLASAQGGVASGGGAVAAVRGRLASLGVSEADIDAIATTPDPERLGGEAFVRAPVSGTVTQRQLTAGQTIVGAVASNGAAGALMTVGDLDHLWVLANAPEDAPPMHIGDAMRIVVPSLDGRAFTARVSAVSPVGDPATHRVPVRADIANPDHVLRPDMVVEADILAGAPAPVIAIPQAAIVYEGADAHVWVADPQRHTLAIRDVRPGISADGLVQILQGLTTQDSIVTSGAVFIDRALSGD